MERVEIDVTPVAKPRMTQQDKWRKRPAVMKYRVFCKEFVLKCRKQGLKDLPDSFGIAFDIPMPKSWSEKKKRMMDGLPHQQKPDLDNLIKAVKDALAEDDSHVYLYHRASKVWGREGKIIIFDPNGS